jgi:hypothetical protein
MTWMLDAHANQILRGLYNEKDRQRWKKWLRYGLVVLLTGIATGGTFLKLRSPSAPIAPVATEIGPKLETTITFPSLPPADLPRMGWRNPEVEKMRWLLKPRPRTTKRDTVHQKRFVVRQLRPDHGLGDLATLMPKCCARFPR